MHGHYLYGMHYDWAGIDAESLFCQLLSLAVITADKVDM